MTERKLSRDEVVRRVLAVLFNLLSVRKGDGGVRRIEKEEKITPDTDIYTDLSIDSIESLDFLTGLEEEFGVNPDQFEANQKRTFHQLVVDSPLILSL